MRRVFVTRTADGDLEAASHVVLGLFSVALSVFFQSPIFISY